MNFKYLLGALFSIPLLPIMYYQGKRIRRQVPRLPEAKGTIGKVLYPSSEKTINLLCIGESTMAGVGVDTHQEGFAGTLAHELSQGLKLNIDWKVVAKSGYTAKNLTDKIVPKIREESPELIVISTGGNDAFQLNSPHKFKKQVQALIQTIRKDHADVPILFTNMPPIKDFPAFSALIKFVIGNLVEIFGDELKALLPQERVYFNDRKIVLKDWLNKVPQGKRASDFFSDGVHPSKITYQVWAKDFAAYMLHSKEIITDLKTKAEL